MFLKRISPRIGRNLVIVFFFVLISGKTGKINAQDTELLTAPWHFNGNNSAAEQYQTVDPNILKTSTGVRLTYNLHGTCLLDGDASALIFDQPANQDWKYISLSHYGQNCFDGNQTVTVPIADFHGLDKTRPVGSLHARFWNPNPFSIDINSITVLDPVQTGVPSVTSDNSYKGEYWRNDGPLSSPPIPSRNADLSRSDTQISFDWNSGSPDPSIASDHFIARWTSTRYLNAGNYRFLTSSDDGIRVWLDNDLLIDQWNDHALKDDGADRYITAGPHNIKVEYYENTGLATAKFNFFPIDTIVPSAGPAPLPAPQSQAVISQGDWAIQSVSSMKETKDKICGQDDSAFINQWVDKARELGANYVAVETPYDNPSCGDSLAYTRTWINIIRSKGLKVWHRHMFLPFEGIYGTPKNNGTDYIRRISDYIKNNPDLFAQDDIFTPQPEPQNGGISGFTYCDQGVCQFGSIAGFNQWLRNAIDGSETAFASIGLGGKIKIGYYGFDGFTAWGSNNPDWHGILEDATIQKMGNITIDHYPELIGQTMKQGLDELQSRYPNVPIVIGEWGSVGSTDVQQQVLDSMGAAKRPGVIGFNYWHLGIGGNEALINSDFTRRAQFSTVQSFFTGQR